MARVQGGCALVIGVFDGVHRGHAHLLQQARETAARLGWTYVDLLEGFKDIEDARALYAIPGDPHPNARGHAIMADILTQELQRIIDGAGTR